MKPESKDIKITLQMTRLEALQHGLLTCTCGHPENNHFSHGTNPCAHCDCKEYHERTRVGKIVE